MHIHCLQHVAFEGPGHISAWAAAQGHTLRCAHVGAGDPLPAPTPQDLLLIMGGPMGVHDHDRYPWLKAETALIAQHYRQGGKLLGICLGGQLIAAALGAEVRRNPVAEIGWFPVHRVAGAETSPFGRALPTSLMAFHWHQDTFELPVDATRLADSAACAHQAFSIGAQVLAVQFHPEMTPIGVQALVDEFGARLRPGAYVEAADALPAPDAQYRPGHALIEEWLGILVGAGGQVG